MEEVDFFTDLDATDDLPIDPEQKISNVITKPILFEEADTSDEEVKSSVL